MHDLFLTYQKHITQILNERYGYHEMTARKKTEMITWMEERYRDEEGR